MTVTALLCDVDGCFNRAVWEVVRGKRTKAVCGKCRDEMCALYGWVAT
jgi:drug/metabolite transporter superfamily protein YnfA